MFRITFNFIKMEIEEHLYITKVTNEELMDVEMWNDSIACGAIKPHTTHGFWVKDGFISGSCAFYTEQLDATHVSYFYVI